MILTNQEQPYITNINKCFTEVTLIANEEILSSSPTLSGSHHAPSSTPRREIPSTMKDFRNSLNQSMSLTKEPKIYVPPAIPPSKEEWMTDAQALKCIICEEAFSMVSNSLKTLHSVSRELFPIDFQSTFNCR